MKRQPTEREEIFVSYISDKRSISRAHKNSYNSTTTKHKHSKIKTDKKPKSREWWCLSTVQLLRRLRQDDYSSQEASLGNMERTYLKQTE
jgi:hypothetical protein